MKVSSPRPLILDPRSRILGAERRGEEKKTGDRSQKTEWEKGCWMLANPEQRSPEDRQHNTS